MINIIYFDGNLIGEPGMSYKSQATLLGILFEHVITLAGADVNEDIDVVLVDEGELFDYWDVPDDSPGFHALTSGAFESIDDNHLSTRNRVVIMVSETALRQHIEEELQLDEMDANDHRYEYLLSHLATVTHELVHCLEFIENSNGLTPAEAGESYEQEGGIPYSFNELCTGHGILFAFDEDKSPEELDDIMESRVEKRGSEWLHACKIDQDFMESVIEHYSPSSMPRNH